MNSQVKLSEDIQAPRRSFNLSRLFPAFVLLLVASLAACGGGSGGGGGGGSSAGVSTGTSQISGTVQGGLTGIANALMELCEAQPSGPPLTLGNGYSDSNGNYTIKYNAPSTPGLLLYVVAKPGNSGNNNLNLLNVVGLSGNTPPSKVVVNELTSVATIYEAVENGLNVSGLSLSGSGSNITAFNNGVSNLIVPSLGTLSTTTTVSSTDQSNLFDLANGLENCINNTSSCSGSTPPNLSNIETATSNLISGSTTGPTVTTVGSATGTFSPTTNASTNSGTAIGTLVTANVGSSGNYTLETFPFSATGSISSSSPSSSIAIPSGQNPVGGGFDSSYNVYAVETGNSTSETVTLYNYNPTTGFGSAINSVTLNATSGNTCNGGGGINPSTHTAFSSCAGSTSPQFCIYFYNASGLQPCVQPSIPSSTNTNYLRGDNQLDLLWLRTVTQNSTSSTYSYSGVYKPSYSSSSVSLGTETTFGPVSFTVPTTSPSTIGFDNTNGLIFVSAYCNSNSCTTQPLQVLTFNTSTGVINSTIPSPQTLNGQNPLNPSLSSNSGNSSSIDQTDQIFFLESFSSGITFNPYSYNSSGVVTSLTPTTISSITSPNGNTNAMLDPTSHIIFVPEGSSSTANGIEALPYNTTGILTPTPTPSPIAPASGLTVPSCSGSNCNNIPNFLFDAVN